MWGEKLVVPSLKVDKGLAAEESGVQLVKPIDTWTTCLPGPVGTGPWLYSTTRLSGVGELEAGARPWALRVRVV
jgi:hypothetical protein